jgi:hypothetical protein
MRWDFRGKMALKAQVDAIRGTRQSMFPIRWEAVDYSGRMNIFSLASDFFY